MSDDHGRRKSPFIRPSLKKAADQGYVPALLEMGLLYEQGHYLGGDYESTFDQGWFTRKDSGKAIALIRAAADQGYPPALRVLGDLYWEGRMVAKSEVKAVHWYRRASEKGNELAQLSLGWRYENGWGVERDENSAIRWYRAAALQGNDEAQARHYALTAPGPLVVSKNSKRNKHWRIPKSPQDELARAVSARVWPDYRGADHYLYRATQALVAGASVKRLDPNRISAVVMRNDGPLLKLLLRHGLNPNEVEGKFLLKTALISGAHETLRVLLDAGAVLRPATDDQTPLLFTAIGQGDAIAAQMLIEAGADVNQWWPPYGTPLQYAFEEGRPELVGILLRHGAVPEELAGRLNHDTNGTESSRSPRLVVNARHSGERATAATFSKDGSLLAIGDASGGIRIYKLPENRMIMRLPGHHRDVSYLRFQEDSDSLISVAGRGLSSVWRHRYVLDASAESGNSTGLVTIGNPGGDFQIIQWDLRSGKAKEIKDSTSALGDEFWIDEPLVRKHLQRLRSEIRAAVVGEEDRNLAEEFGTHHLLSNGKLILLPWPIAKSFRIFDIADRKLVFTGPENYRFLAVSGEFVAAEYSYNGKVILFPISKKEQSAQLAMGADIAPEITQMAIRDDGGFLAFRDSNGRVGVWDLSSGREVNRYNSSAFELRVANILGFPSNSPSDEVFLFGMSAEDKWRVLALNLITDESRWINISTKPDTGESGYRSVALGEKIIAYEGNGGDLLVGDMLGNVIRRWTGVNNGKGFVEYAIDSGGKFIGVVKENLRSSSTLQLFDIETGKATWKLTAPMVDLSPGFDGIAISMQQDSVASISNDCLVFFSIEKGEKKAEICEQRYTGHVSFLALSPSEELAAVGSYTDDSIVLLDTKTKTKRSVLSGHSGGVSGLKFMRHRPVLISSGKDGSIALWNVTTGGLIARLFSFGEQGWAVISPDGRYDSNHPGDLPGMSWVMPDDPLTPLPVEIFMKEYYTPRLLPRLLAEEQLPPVRALGAINRVQPQIEIVGVQQESTMPKTVRVEVEVGATSKKFQRDGKDVVLSSGVYDVRLLREGQLVGYAPEDPGEVRVDGKTGKTRLMFRNVRIPDGVEEVGFSAYAFNVDGVKSETAKYQYHVDAVAPAKSGRAYLISIGVNAYENPTWDLQYAAKDARVLNETVAKALRESGEYAEVIPLSLISDGEDKAATKQAMASVFAALAGKPVGADQMASIPGATALEAAGPEDLVIVTYSGHGYAESSGTFYLFPADIGGGRRRQVDQDLLKHLVSTNDLARWLRDVDAGDWIMVVDACNSAATVAGTGDFRPGPMGSRGLGQLAYDKRMRVLAASQVESDAYEFRELGHGILTYSLVLKGLREGAADQAPKDGLLKATEWLKYAEDQVPKLFKELRAGSSHLAAEAPDEVRGEVIFLNGSQRVETPNVQRPALFDFASKDRDVIMQKTIAQ